MNATQNILVLLVLTLLAPIASLLADVPTIPEGPSGVIFSCEGAEDDFGCFSIITDINGEQTRIKKARRTVRKELRKTRRARKSARRSGDTDLFNELTDDIVLLKLVRTKAKECNRYDDPFCEGTPLGGGTGGGETGGGETGGGSNSALAEACEALGDSPDSDRVVSRIVNGAICTRGDSPIVPILNQGSAHCTGSVIAANVVVTAAHCVSDTDCGSLTVTTGSGQSQNVQNCIAHPNYDGQSEDNDVALLILSGNLDSRVIKLQTTADIKEGEKVSFAGYGRNEVDDDNLRATFNYLSDVTSGSLVVEYSQGQEGIGNSCNGDSGGPLAIVRDDEWVLIGAVSNGDATDCALPGKEQSDVSRWANLTSSSNMNFIKDNTSGIID